MDKIKGCFIDEGLDAIREVKLNDVIIARIQALSKSDQSKIEQEAMKKKFVNGKIEFDINTIKTQVLQIQFSLVEWAFDRDITEENVGKLDAHYYNALNKAVAKMINAFEKRKPAIQKNLHKQSE